MAYIDEAVIRKQGLIKKIEADSTIPEHNKEILRKFLKNMNARNLNDRTIVKHLYNLGVFLRVFNGTLLDKATKDDVQDAFALIKDTKYSVHTKIQIKASVMCLFKWLLGNDEFYPPQVSWMTKNLKFGKPKVPEPSDMITRDERDKLVNATFNIRDRAIVSLLWESGIRIGELIGMRVKDVNLTGRTGLISVDGKTGQRTIPIVESVGFLAEFMKTTTEKKPNDWLWRNISNNKYLETHTDYSGIRMMLKRLAKRAGVMKAVNPHNFRHTSASRLANVITEEQLKKQMGWSGSTKMSSVYVHMSNRDLEHAYAKAYGLTTEEEKKHEMGVMNNCARCNFANDKGASYCGRCGNPLSMQVAVQQKEDGEILQTALAKYLENPKMMEELVHNYLLAKAKKKRG